MADELQTIQDNLLSPLGVEADENDTAGSVNEALRRAIDMFNADDPSRRIEFGPHVPYTPALGQTLLERVREYRADSDIGAVLDLLEKDGDTLIETPARTLIRTSGRANIPQSFIDDPDNMGILIRNAEGTIAALDAFYRSPELSLSASPPLLDVSAVTSLTNDFVAVAESADESRRMSYEELAAFRPHDEAENAESAVPAQEDSAAEPAAAAAIDRVEIDEEPAGSGSYTDYNSPPPVSDIENVRQMLGAFVPMINTRIGEVIEGGEGLMGLFGNLFGPKPVEMPGDDLESTNRSLQGALPYIVRELGVETDNSWHYTPQLGAQIRDAFPKLLEQRWAALEDMTFGADISALRTGDLTEEIDAQVKGISGMTPEKYRAFRKSLEEYQNFNVLNASRNDGTTMLQGYLRSLDDLYGAGQITDEKLGAGSMLGNSPFGGVIRAIVGFLSRFIPGIGEKLDNALPGLGIMDVLEEGGAPPRSDVRQPARPAPEPETASGPEASADGAAAYSPAQLTSTVALAGAPDASDHFGRAAASGDPELDRSAAPALQGTGFDFGGPGGLA